MKGLRHLWFWETAVGPANYTRCPALPELKRAPGSFAANYALVGTNPQGSRFAIMAAKPLPRRHAHFTPRP